MIASGCCQAQLPSRWVMRFAGLTPPPRHALDVACGRGRHARALAAMGFAVTALDRDEAAIRDLQGVPGVRAMRADIENDPWPHAGPEFDLVVVTNYLFRPRFACLLDALREGGLLVYETFMAGNERFGKPASADFLLQPGELLERVAGRCRVLAFEQGEVTSPRRAVVQRICAVRGEHLMLVPSEV